MKEMKELLEYEVQKKLYRQDWDPANPVQLPEPFATLMEE